MVCEVPPDRPLLTAQEPTTEPNKDLAVIERDKDFLFQLPPSYHYTPARLKTIVSQLDSGRRNVVEFRHSSWWNEKVYSAFKAHGVIFCSCSGPKLPDTIVNTADDIYIRFHGTEKWYRHNYSKEEMAEWAQRIHDCGASQVWAYFNNDNDGYAIKNARELLSRLKQLRVAIMGRSISP